MGALFVLTVFEQDIAVANCQAVTVKVAEAAMTMEAELLR